MPLERHVRISFELMAMCLLSTDCSFNETGKKDQMKKSRGGLGGDKRYELILTTLAPVA